MHIVISGGTGLIGRALSGSLINDGHRVTVLSRNPMEADGLPDGTNLYRWDACTAEGWGHLAEGADAIVNLAGEGIADGRWSKSRKMAIRDSRINAGKAIREAIAATTDKPRVLIQSSAVGYYGPHSDDLITEETSPGSDYLAKICFDWELSTASVEGLGVRRAVTRTGIVLSNEGGAFPRMVMPFKFYVGGPVGSGEQWMPWIHIEDEVRAIRFLIENDAASGPFNLSAPDPVTNSDFGAAIGNALGRPNFMPAPGFAMKLGFGEMSTILLTGQRAVPTRLEALGFTFKFATIDAALADLLNRSGAPAAGAAVPESVEVAEKVESHEV